MSPNDVLSRASSLLLDSAPVIYYLEGHPVYAPLLQPLFQRIDAGLTTAFTTPVTLAECLVLPAQTGAHELVSQFRQTIAAAPHTRFVAIDDQTATLAARIRAAHRCSLLDAF